MSGNREVSIPQAIGTQSKMEVVSYVWNARETNLQISQMFTFCLPNVSHEMVQNLLLINVSHKMVLNLLLMHCGRGVFHGGQGG